jgi:uncharacterized membrane protein YhaH (DUF805 family)
MGWYFTLRGRVSLKDYWLRYLLPSFVIGGGGVFLALYLTQGFTSDVLVAGAILAPFFWRISSSASRSPCGASTIAA